MDSNTENQQNVQRRDEKVQRKEDNVQRVHDTNRNRVDFTNGVCSKWRDKCNTVFSRIAESISMKNDIPKSVVTNFSYTKISYSLFLTMLTCVRGSQSHKSNINIAETDINIY